jgi:fatty acid desaturase
MSESVHPYAVKQPWRFRVRVGKTPLPPIDYKAFADDVQALRAKLVADLGDADLQHLKKMERWGRTCTLLGYSLAWIPFPNPLAALLIALGNVARWTMVTHHVSHRGYDKIPNVPARYTSKQYAIGWRRFIDWLDWMHPAAWAHEHNVLHHYHTGELDDPDLVEHNTWIVRGRFVPLPLKLFLLAILIPAWKLLYYAPNTFWAYKQHRRIRAQSAEEAKANPLPTMGNVWRFMFPGERVVLPVTPRAWEFYLRCVLPYGLVRFGLIPALFLPLGTWAWSAVLLNTIIAEAIANIHSFLIIVPNHAGDDVYRFDGPITDKAEFFVRQVVGSVNYPGGTDVKDFLAGFLNYQIEHHVWPDLPMLKLRQAAPQLKEICRRHGVPYIDESVWKRFAQLWRIIIGSADMRRTDTVAATERNVPTEARVRNPDAMAEAAAP